jgi:hypothetical protein
VVEDPAYFAPFCNLPAIYGTDGIGGAASGAQLQVDCPSLEIHQNPICAGTKPLTYVSFEASDNFYSGTSGIGNCMTTASDQLLCTEPDRLYICSWCSVSFNIPAQCPDGYAFDAAAGACIGQGGPGECLPGTTPSQTDAGSPCCTFEAGAPAPSTTLAPAVALDLKGSSPACPAGTWLLIQFPNLKACIPVPVDDPYCKVEAVAFKDCEPGGGGTSCPPPPGGCTNTGEEWNEGTCSCYCPAGPGNCG